MAGIRPRPCRWGPGRPRAGRRAALRRPVPGPAPREWVEVSMARTINRPPPDPFIFRSPDNIRPGRRRNTLGEVPRRAERRGACPGLGLDRRPCGVLCSMVRVPPSVEPTRWPRGNTDQRLLSYRSEVHPGAPRFDQRHPRQPRSPGGGPRRYQGPGDRGDLLPRRHHRLRAQPARVHRPGDGADCKVTLLGNHDQGAMFDPDGFNIGAERAIFWTREQLENPNDRANNEKRWEFLGMLPRVHRQDSFLFVHGSPRNPLSEYIFPEDIYNHRKMERLFQLVEKYCFQGHTHVPGVFTEGYQFYAPEEIDHEYTLGEGKVMINVGSVGQPRDGDPRACYVILDDGMPPSGTQPCRPKCSRRPITRPSTPSTPTSSTPRPRNAAFPRPPRPHRPGPGDVPPPALRPREDDPEDLRDLGTRTLPGRPAPPGPLMSPLEGRPGRPPSSRACAPPRCQGLPHDEQREAASPHPGPHRSRRSTASSIGMERAGLIKPPPIEPRRSWIWTRAGSLKPAREGPAAWGQPSRRGSCPPTSSPATSRRLPRSSRPRFAAPRKPGARLVKAAELVLGSDEDDVPRRLPPPAPTRPEGGLGRPGDLGRVRRRVRPAAPATRGVIPGSS